VNKSEIGPIASDTPFWKERTPLAPVFQSCEHRSEGDREAWDQPAQRIAVFGKNCLNINSLQGEKFRDLAQRKEN